MTHQLLMSHHQTKVPRRGCRELDPPSLREALTEIAAWPKHSLVYQSLSTFNIKSFPLRIGVRNELVYFSLRFLPFILYLGFCSVTFIESGNFVLEILAVIIFIAVDLHSRAGFSLVCAQSKVSSVFLVFAV